MTHINKDSSYLKAHVIDDSIFHGLVEYFDKENNKTAYSYYTYGLRNGPSVNYLTKVKLLDSVSFINGLQEGFGYKYDSIGRIEYRSFYFNGRNVGHVYKYNKIGSIEEYYFSNFENKLIYSIKPLTDSTFEEGGEEINATIYNRFENGKNKDILFLYLLDPPYYKSYYEIAIFDKKNKIISSKKIEGNLCFYEQVLDELAPNNTYGIVLHKFNKYKNKNDLIIKLVQ